MPQAERIKFTKIGQCKNCKWWVKMKRHSGYCNHWQLPDGSDQIGTNANWGCIDWERKK